MPASVSLHRFTLSALYQIFTESYTDVEGLFIGSVSSESGIFNIEEFVILQPDDDRNIETSKIIGYFKYRPSTCINTCTLNELNYLSNLIYHVANRETILFAIFTDVVSSPDLIENYYSFRTISAQFNEAPHLLPLSKLSTPIPVNIDNLVSTNSKSQQQYKFNSQFKYRSNMTPSILLISSSTTRQHLEDYYNKSIEELKSLSEQVMKSRQLIEELKKKL